MTKSGETAPVISSKEGAISLLTANQDEYSPLLAEEAELINERQDIDAENAKLVWRAIDVAQRRKANGENKKDLEERSYQLINQAVQTLPFDEALDVYELFSGISYEEMEEERAKIGHLNSLFEQFGSFPALVFGRSSDDDSTCAMVVTMTGAVRFEQLSDELYYYKHRNPRLCMDAKGKAFYDLSSRRDNSDRIPRDTAQEVCIDSRTIITDREQILAMMEERLPVLSPTHTDKDERELAEADFILLATLNSVGLLSEAQVNMIRSSQVVHDAFNRVLQYTLQDGRSESRVGNMIDAIQFFFPAGEGTIAKRLFLDAAKKARGTWSYNSTVEEAQRLARVATEHGLKITIGEVADTFATTVISN